MTSARRFLKVMSRIEANDLVSIDDFEESFDTIHRFEDMTQRLLLFGLPTSADFKTLSKRLEECATYRIKLITLLALFQQKNENNNQCG